MAKTKRSVRFDTDLYQVIQTVAETRSASEGKRVTTTDIINEALHGVFADAVARLKRDRLAQMDYHNRSQS